MTRNDWQDDPEIQQRLREGRVRNGILRTAIIWTPLFLVSAVALVYFLADILTGGNQGTWFLIVVLSIFTVLFGFQAIQAIMDLRSEPRHTEDIVTRRWSRSDSLVMRSHYIRLASKQILRGDLDLLMEVKEGDRVSVRFYPHSAILVSLDRLAEPPKVPLEQLREEDSNL
ncbi:MAG: hypothetical protein IT303_07145 [Dehalococcoidia bacterium]|nr:hypothetical protein [Dehalococcoidia bacterium]